MFKSANRILVAIVCVIALFIPLYIAVGYYTVARNAPPSAGNVTELIITDPKGGTFELNAGASETSDDIAWFIGINDRAIRQESAPEQLKELKSFKFEYRIYDRSQTYKYYFTEKTGEAYFLDAKGTAYRIAEEDAATFLSSKYARCLYNTTTFPTLTVSDKTVTPMLAEWKYQTYGGDYIKLEDIPMGDVSDELFPMKGAFALSFDVIPDSVNVTVNADGEQLYNDKYENIANVQLEGKTIDVTVNAKWYQSETNPCEGSATYKFKAKILLPAKFFLGETSVNPGEFVVISAKNVDNPEDVVFTSEPDIGFTPRFFIDGDYARALVPISYDCIDTSKGPATVKFTCSYGEVNQEMTLDIEQYTYKSSTLDISTSTVNATRTTRTLNAFDEAMAPVVEETDSKPLWDGPFTEPLAGGLIRIGFGRYVTIAKTSTTYRHQGIDYLPNGSKTALAMSSGKVAYTGYLDLTGYLVVIDHGLGLKSWYAHLASCSVEVGDTVAAGDPVGVVGMYGFTETTKLHAGVSVFDIPVSPYPLYEEGILMTK